MFIRSCKVKMDVKSNLYASLDIIPEIGTNGSKPLKMDSYIIKSIQNSPKWSKTVQNYRKGVKNFKFFL